MTIWAPTKDSRIKKRGEVYWARFMKRGQHVQQSLETTSFAIAKAQVENIESDILLGVNWRKERELFETAWPEFLIDKVKGIKTRPARESTIKGYSWFGDNFFIPAFNDLRLSQIDEMAWDELVKKIQKEKPGMHFDNVRKYLSGFLSWAYRKGKIRVKPELYDPDRARKEQQDHDSPGLAYTIEQMKIMREIAKKQSPRFYLFMLMAQYMGMRPSEITQLKKDRVSWDEQVIRLRKADTKTKSAREVPIHGTVWSLLKSQCDATAGSPFVFPNHNHTRTPMDPTGFKKYWNAILEHPDINGRVYDFRHTFITHAIKQGMNPVAVGRMTGTSLQMIEKRYLHLTVKDLSENIERLIL